MTKGQLVANQQRLWNSLMDHGQIGATEKGGLNRLALTNLDAQGRKLLIKWCQEAGCKVRIDQIGNIFARRPGSHNDLPPVAMGSHIDTQPTGGKFDGCFGVLSGLEVIRSLNDLDIQTVAPIEVIAWTNEEGARFPPCMMGSGVFTGKLSLDEVLDTRDSDGVTVKEALEAIDFVGKEAVPGHRVSAYFEAHIEQGPILEDENKTIGIVLGALGQKWFDLEIIGVEAHAGPTPMHLRRDAGLAASEINLFINSLALKNAPSGRGTVGSMWAFPNSRNVIPGKFKMTIDLRHLESVELEKMVQALQAKLEQIEKTYQVKTQLIPTADFPPLKFDADCIEAIRTATNSLDYRQMDIVSGAGHDAIFMADVTRAGMIFVPCEKGISHNEQEKADAVDLAAGASVLLNAVIAMAGVDDE